jgi:hypothetical protein
MLKMTKDEVLEDIRNKIRDELHGIATRKSQSETITFVQAEKPRCGSCGGGKVR